MKKWISLLLCLCLLLSSVSVSASAMTVTVGSTSTDVDADGQSTNVVSLAGIGATSYLLYADGRITALDPVTRQETALGKALYSGDYLTQQEITDALTGDNAGLTPMELLLVDNGKLYGLCVATGALYTLLDDTGAFAPQATGVTLNTAGLIVTGSESKLTVLDSCVSDGVYYLITRDDSSSAMATALMSITLATGEAKTYTVQNLQNIEAYQSGTLLARRYDMSALYTATSTENMPGTDYGTFAPATDTYTSLGDIAGSKMLGGYAIGNMVYSPTNDSLYYLNGSRIEGLTLSTGETRVSAYTSEGMFGAYSGQSKAIYMDGGYYISGDASGWKVYQLDTDAVKNGALRIFGEFGSDAHKTFSQNYPDIPVEVSDDYTTSLEALANAMVSESDAYDVLLLMMSYMPVERLIQKGYCTDLSVYPEIMERAAKLDPRFVAGMTVDGKLYGVPVSSTAFSCAVNMEQWEALGLTKDDLPTTQVEFFDFIANYMADYGEDNPDVRLFDMGGENLKTMIFSLMLDNYITYCQAALNGETVFDSDLCRELLTAFEQIDFDALKDNTDTTSTDYQAKDSLFMVYMPLTTFNSYYDGFTPLIMSLTADTQPVLGANLSVLVINPKSKRTDDAVKYICNYLDNLDDSSAIVLNPNDNEPRISKTYEQDLKSLNDAIAKKQTLLTSAEDSQKAGIEEEIAQLKTQLEEVEKNKFSVSAEQIERFRTDISGLLAVCQQSVLYSADEAASSELNKLIMQYLSGAVTQDQFLKEMDKRARMMQLENQ